MKKLIDNYQPGQDVATPTAAEGEDKIPSDTATVDAAAAAVEGENNIQGEEDIKQPDIGTEEVVSAAAAAVQSAPAPVVAAAAAEGENNFIIQSPSDTVD